jgi:hypothetical protein
VIVLRRRDAAVARESRGVIVLRHRDAAVARGVGE